MTKKTAQLPHDTCFALSASQYVNCGSYAFGALWFLCFLWWAEEVPYFDCAMTAASRTRSPLSVPLAVLRGQTRVKLSVKSQNKYSMQVVYANYFNPWTSQPVGIGHYKLILYRQILFKPTELYIKFYWQFQHFQRYQICPGEGKTSRIFSFDWMVL